MEPNHATTWRVMATIAGLELIACSAIAAAWIFGPFVDIIENFYNVPDCDFACFLKVSNQLAVIRILCILLYSLCAISALFAMYGFLAGRHKYIAPLVVMCFVRIVTVLFICCFLFNLTYNFTAMFIANWVLLLVTATLNAFTAIFMNIGFNLERARNLRESQTDVEPLVRPLSGHSSYGSFRSRPSEEPVLQQEEGPAEQHGEFFQRRPIGFTDLATT